MQEEAEDRAGERWYATQKQLDLEATVRSESLMGPEKTAFVQTMALLARAVDAALSGGPAEDSATKVKVAVANHAFNLLWSAWNDALGGRYDAAMHHLRSIDESPDLLAALRVQPSLADKMIKGKQDVKTARATIRKKLEELGPDYARKWDAQRDWRWVHHKFAHPTFPAIAGTLPLAVKDAGASFVVKPGGGVLDQAILRGVAMSLGESALDVLRAVAFALQDVSAVEALWEKEGRVADAQCRPLLVECARDLGVAGG